ncbi:MAG: hypothetical protein GQ531_09830 [Sulfurovum sp.]|nr:hypothetical protein [Sulfurovum sp.]
MKTDHLKLYLSEGRPLDATEAIQNKVISDVQESLESIKDPEDLLSKRKALRSKKEQLQATIKRQKTTISKSNKQRDAMLAQWLAFKTAYAEFSRKHGIDFEAFPAHLTHGKTFGEMIQNISPDTFVTVEGLRIPQKRTDATLDDDKIKLFEVEATQDMLEDIIKRKATAMKELFSSDQE